MIANTILQQLGGHGFTVMTGSRNYINLGNGLQMSLARNKTSANRLKIILDEDTDTYTMYFYRQTLTKYADIKVKEIAKYEGVYFDMLQQIFTDVTGLYTRLQAEAARAALLSFGEQKADKESSKETYMFNFKENIWIFNTNIHFYDYKQLYLHSVLL